MTKIRITIRHRGRSRRYRRMLRTLPEYRGRVLLQENARRTVIDAEFDADSDAFWFTFMVRDAAIEVRLI